MRKCDFCTECLPDGKCFWASQSSRREYCEKAIKKMGGALKGGNVFYDNGNSSKRGKPGIRRK